MKIASFTNLFAMSRGMIILALFLISAVGCTTRIDQAKFESLNRAAKAIQGSLATGASYLQFNELLQNFSTEVLIMQDKVKSAREKELLKSYSEALLIYKDSAALWREAISAREGCGGGGYISVNSAMMGILIKYDISPSYCDKGGATIPKDTFSEVFNLAEKPMSYAAKQYRDD